MKKSLSEQINAIEARRNALEARLAALCSRKKTDDRKRDTRRKIIVGGAVLAHMEFDPAFADALRAVLHKVVTRKQDVETLGNLLTEPEQPEAAIAAK